MLSGRIGFDGCMPVYRILSCNGDIGADARRMFQEYLLKPEVSIILSDTSKRIMSN